MLNNSPLKNIKSAEELLRTLNKLGYNLAEDGYVGNKTKAALNDHLSKLKKSSTTEVVPTKTTPILNSVDKIYSYPFLNNRDLDLAKYNSWHAWDKIAKRWRDTHKGQRFAEAMKLAGYTYDSNLGRYMNGTLGYVPSKRNPNKFIMVDNNNNFIDNITLDEVIANINYNIKREQDLKQKEQNMKRWDIFMNNNTYKGPYAKTGAKLIKKHSSGGWINEKKGIWDYSDGPQDIQKKIARYYINFSENNEGDANLVTAYLSKHTNLAKYLDSVYSKGVDWKKLRTLGNNNNFYYLDYRNSKGDVNFTNKYDNNKRDQYAKSLGYSNYEDFKNALIQAGYNTNNAGTEVTRKDDNGNEIHYYAVKLPKKGMGFVSPDGTRLGVTKQALESFKAAQAKKAALNSNASNNWLKVSSFLNMKGHFYDKMIKSGYKYNSENGTYTKCGNVYSVNDQGKVFKNDSEIHSKYLFNN